MDDEHAEIEQLQHDVLKYSAMATGYKLELDEARADIEAGAQSIRQEREEVARLTNRNVVLNAVAQAAREVKAQHYRFARINDPTQKRLDEALARLDAGSDNTETHIIEISFSSRQEAEIHYNFLELYLHNVGEIGTLSLRSSPETHTHNHTPNAAAERAAIIAWLRTEAGETFFETDPEYKALMDAAASIERGEYV